MMIASNAGDTVTFARWLGGTGAALACACIIFAGVLPSNTVAPHVSQYATQPNE